MIKEISTLTDAVKVTFGILEKQLILLPRVDDTVPRRRRLQRQQRTIQPVYVRILLLIRITQKHGQTGSIDHYKT